MLENPTLPDDLLHRGLALAGLSITSDRRKTEAWRRYLFLREDFAPLVAARIAGTHYDAHTIDRLCDWVDCSLNLPLDTLREICVVWNKPVRRTVAGVSDEKNEALAKLYREELRFDNIAQDFNRHAFFLNEATLVPRVINGKVQLQRLLPFFYDTVDNPDDPTGPPWALIYTLRDNNQATFWNDYSPEPSLLRNGDTVVLDGSTWRTFERGTARLIDESEHGLGYVPAATLRFHEPMDGDRWSNYRQNRRLYDAGVKVSVIDTQMSWIRKSQNRWHLVATGQMPANQDDQQTANPESGYVMPTDSPADIAIQTLNFDTDPENFIKHISFAYQQVAQSYGGSAHVTLGEGGAVQSTMEFPFEAQTEIREDQIPYARAFEKDLCKKVIDVMTLANHPMVRDLPTVEEIEEGFTADFGRLSRTFANVDDEIKYFDFQKENGVVNQTDLFDRTDPELTEEQRKEKIEKNLEITADFHDIAASRNMPMGPDGEIQTLPQIQGELGPQMRDGKPPAKQPPDDDRDE